MIATDDVHCDAVVSKRFKKVIPIPIKSPEINELPIVIVITKVNDMANIVFQKIRKKYIRIEFLSIIEKYVRTIANTAMCII